MSKPTEDRRIYRLSEMLVEEVSLVDRAANKKKFLIIKRATDMGTGAEVTQQKDGSFTAGSTPAPTTSGDPTPAPAPPTEARKAAVSLTADAKAAMASLIEAAGAMLEGARALVDGAEIVETEEEMQTSELADAVMGCVEALDDGMSAMLGMATGPAAEPAAEVPPSGEMPVAAAAPPAPPQPAFSKRLEVLRAKRVVAKSEGAPVAASVLAKYGVKLKRSRRDRLAAALSMIQEVMGEVGGQEAAEKAAEDEKDKDKTKSAKTDVAKVAPAEKTRESALERRVLELTEIVQQQSTRLAKAEALRGSNALDVEDVPQRASEEVSWPLDMNRDFSKVEKNIRFGETD